MAKNKCFAEVYSEPIETSVIEVFRKNRKQVIAVTYFSKIIHPRYAAGS